MNVSLIDELRVLKLKVWWDEKQTWERNGWRESEDSGVATGVAELAVGEAGEDFSAVAKEELDCIFGVWFHVG